MCPLPTPSGARHSGWGSRTCPATRPHGPSRGADGRRREGGASEPSGEGGARGPWSPVTGQLWGLGGTQGAALLRPRRGHPRRLSVRLSLSEPTLPFPRGVRDGSALCDPGSEQTAGRTGSGRRTPSTPREARGREEPGVRTLTAAHARPRSASTSERKRDRQTVTLPQKPADLNKSNCRGLRFLARVG